MTRPTTLSLLFLLLSPAISHAFCGFYVAKADSKLFNEASQVVMVRDDDRTVLTLSNDFQGELNGFAMVIPVPTFLEREQIHVTDRAIIEHLDAYTAPRLVEYFDEDPCVERMMMRAMPTAAMPEVMMDADASAAQLGVTIEASYNVGEYDILILSAKDSNGLISWLTGNGYRIPDGAEAVVNSYLKQGMRFFVAKVNLEQQAELGYNYLRPIQVAYESNKYMLPIRLGMANAKDQQELFVYALNRTGRVESSNYRTAKIPSDIDIPVYIKDEFGAFYRDMFRTAVAREDGRAVFLEYAWDMNWCDPCAADPLSRDELLELGVFWLDQPSEHQPALPNPRIMPRPQASDVFVTRLHLRYDNAHFPEDVFFQTTGNRDNFQGRYVMRHPWTGGSQCSAAADYRDTVLPKRLRQEARNLASLTGWQLADIYQKIPQLSGVAADAAEPQEKWWKKLWKAPASGQ